MPTKTWTTTAEFETGTYTGLTTSGDELALGFSSPGAWAAGGNCNVAVRMLGGCGTQGAGLKIGGYNSASASIKTTEKYDGAAWTSVNDLGAVNHLMAVAGTQIAALAFGGSGDIQRTDIYDGTNWTSGNDMVAGRDYHAGFGLQDAAVASGGFFGGTQASVEEYDGTTWATVNPLSQVRKYHAGAGILSAGIVFGGDTGTYSLTCEEYDGTNWAAGGSLSQARAYLSGTGLQNATLAVGGFSGAYTARTEEYDGTTWSNGGNLALARHLLACAGSQGAGLSFAGYDGSQPVVNTEEYSQPLVASGTWTIDIDASAIVSWTSLSCSKTAGDVQARCKSAVNQAGLGGASWVPSTGYYTTYPVVVTAANNQWFRLEFSLSGGATVQDITQTWAAILGGNPSSHFGLGMNRKLQL